MTSPITGAIPWGRTLQEYELMFGLSDVDCRRRILGCADGPASFNAELTARGASVISCDPIYEQSAESIDLAFRNSVPAVMSRLQATPENFVWKTYSDPEALLEQRRKALRTFVADFPDGRGKGRYVTSALPVLPFADSFFDLALCSHFLFLYSHVFSSDFHVASILELRRVAREVRVFPLVDMDGHESRHLPAVLETLASRKIPFRLEKADYQVQRNGDTRLVISK